MKRLVKADLNEDQLNALEYMHAFLKGPNRQMVLTGPAGTGKTSLINVLLDELDADMGYKYVCTAPTNKAVGVIATNTGRPFNKTIYSIMGLVLMEVDDKTPVLKEQGSCHFEDYDLVIIDEASMVSETLVDNIQKKLMEVTRTKIIYVGDKCQLPPVDDQNRGLKESVVFQLSLNAELTKVMRTSDQNPILGAVTAMRANMQSPVDLFDHVSKVGENNIGITFYDRQKEFMSKMLTYFTNPKFKEDSNYALAVAYTNMAVDAINERVRNALYPNSAEYVVGEEIRVVQPYGLEGYVRDEKGKSKQGTNIIYSIEERLKILECEACNDPVYDIPCYKMKVVNFGALDFRQMKITAYVVRPSAMPLFYKRREEEATKAKQKMIETGHGGSKLYTKKEAWEEYMKFKNYYLFVGYIYALTTHKAQGSTIENVFVVERNINRLTEDDELRNKLKYTAFTRAAKELHVLM